MNADGAGADADADAGRSETDGFAGGVVDDVATGGALAIAAGGALGTTAGGAFELTGGGANDATRNGDGGESFTSSSRFDAGGGSGMPAFSAVRSSAFGMMSTGTISSGGGFDSAIGMREGTRGGKDSTVSFIAAVSALVSA